jgi:DNA helicase-2/ATP-dependent DNA helicase PcrA
MATEPAEIAEEKRILQTVRENLMRLKAAEPIADHAATLVSLRESLSEARLPEDTASIMEQMERTAALMAQQQKSVEGTADPENPYFGRMVLADESGSKRSILIGKSTFISDRVRIVDWRNAPISRIFYQYGQGDTYEERINGRPTEGEVALRRTMTIAGGELRRVATEDHTWVRSADGWLDMRDREARLAGGAGVAIRPDSLGTGHASGRRDKHLPEIASLLDPEQFKLITGHDSGVVVIQGSAGSGKTTVGLHRIAWLAFQAPKVFKPKQMMVVVFSRALTAYISQVLPALGVDGVRVREYGDWAAELRRWHYKALPERYCDTTPALVVRFKTHTALLRMLDEVGRTHRGQAPRKVFDELLTNLDWISRGLSRHAPGAFSDGEVARIHRWCCDRFNERDDAGGRKADPDADEGPSLDREDDTILLRLWQVLKGGLHDDKKEVLEYAHLMVDEAQDLSPLELAVLIGATGTRRSVTLAGDVAQKVRENREFPSWTEVLDALRLGHIDISPLQVSYRSTRQIMELAHAILGPLAPAEMATTTREGAPVGHLRFDSRGSAATWLGPALGDLMRREPSASVAVLTVNSPDAVEWYHILERCEVPHLRLVEDQDFAFAPGVEVVDIRSAKGLEFDYVVVVGVDAGPFGLLDQARHLLHVAATRAAHQLWLVSTGTPSPLLPPDLPGLAM